MPPTRAEQLLRIESELEGILERARAFETEYAAQLAEVHPRQRCGALNFVHYLALRQTDTTRLHDELNELGLGLLEGVEARAFDSVASILNAVRHLLGRTSDSELRDRRVGFRRGHARLRRQTSRLLGPKRTGAPSRIMVTLPSEAAEEYGLVREMLEAGMNCARINCAHDTPDRWRRMIEHVRRASEETGRPCRIFMDLAGPKIRIGGLEAPPGVLRIEPDRDRLGRVQGPARIRIVAQGAGDGGRGLVLPVSDDLHARIEPGCVLEITDTRGEPREVVVEAVDDGVAWATCGATAYFESGLDVVLRAPDGEELVPGRLGTLPSPEPRMLLRKGDRLVLHKDPRPGAGPRRDPGTGRVEPGHVSCSLPEIVDSLEVGHTVYFDDGKIRGEVVAVRPGEAEVEVTRAGLDGTKLKGFKGLNLPDSDLGLYGLTTKDREDLRFVVEHADGVNVSFVNHPDDVEDLLDELEALGGTHLGLVLKIETRAGVTHLPGILLAAMEWPAVGIMVARGDLAVEVGWLELAEVIEEILFLCEAAHVPAIWATEVLSRLAKKGVPSRGEVSDVIMAGRAECIMLNKGPYITWAIEALDQLLVAFQAYRQRKSTRLPALRLELPDPEEVGRSIGLREGRWH